MGFLSPLATRRYTESPAAASVPVARSLKPQPHRAAAELARLYREPWAEDPTGHNSMKPPQSPTRLPPGGAVSAPHAPLAPLLAHVPPEGPGRAVPALVPGRSGTWSPLRPVSGPDRRAGIGHGPWSRGAALPHHLDGGTRPRAREESQAQGSRGSKQNGNHTETWLPRDPKGVGPLVSCLQTSTSYSVPALGQRQTSTSYSVPTVGQGL